MFVSKGEKEMTTALIIIDMQNDYFPGGKMELKGALEASEQAERLLRQFRENNAPIFHVQHIAVNNELTFFLPETKGVQIHDHVKPIADEVVIKKHFPNSFRHSTLLNELRKAGIKNLVICGMMTHMCVDATVRAACDYGFDCTVIADACATKDLTFHDKTISAEHVQAAFLASLDGWYGKVLTTEQYVSLHI